MMAIEKKTEGVQPELVALLKADYQRRIEALAEALAPRFKSGEVGGWYATDERSYDDCSLRALELECRKVFCGTETLCDGDDTSTFLTLALSSSTTGVYDAGATLEDNAGMAAAQDVLRVALIRGWWKLKPGELPSAETLFEEAARP